MGLRNWISSKLNVLVIVTFLLARIGKDFDGFNPIFGENLDGIWMGQGTLVAWLIIAPATIIGIILGDQIAWRTDAFLSLSGAFLYIACGSIVIDNNLSYLTPEETVQGIALALGSFSIITGTKKSTFLCFLTAIVS